MQRTITHPLAGNTTSGSLEPSGDVEGPSYVDSVLFGRRRTSPGPVAPELGSERMRKSDKANSRGMGPVAGSSARGASEQERN